MKIKKLKLTLFDFYFGRQDLFEVFGDYVNAEKISVKEYYAIIKRLKICIKQKFPDVDKKTFFDFSMSHDSDTEIIVPMGIFDIKRKSKLDSKTPSVFKAA